MKNDTRTPMIVTYILLAMIGSITGGLFFHIIPTENKDIVNAIVQTLLTLTVAAVTYYVGSSASSKAKDDKTTPGLIIPEPSKESASRTVATITTTTTTPQTPEPKPDA